MQHDVNREGCDNESAQLYGSLRVIKSYPMNITYANVRANPHSAPLFAACNRIALALNPARLVRSTPVNFIPCPSSVPFLSFQPSPATDSPEYFSRSVPPVCEFTLANQVARHKSNVIRRPTSNNVPVHVEVNA